jgi:CHAT domain-containing protein
MTRSGLLFAGANHILSGQPVPDGCDDGILTAKEISTLDLRGLDLLVLSACQTGLGEIKGDGVYGLQRGFKMAGAQTIVMSLWKVDDEATRILMTEFYKNYLSGKTKRESLLLAQQTLRKTHPEPEYWASFILLDALN